MTKKTLASAFALTLLLGACTGSVTDTTDTGMDDTVVEDETMDDSELMEPTTGSGMTGSTLDAEVDAEIVNPLDETQPTL